MIMPSTNSAFLSSSSLLYILFSPNLLVNSHRAKLPYSLFREVLLFRTALHLFYLNTFSNEKSSKRRREAYLRNSVRKEMSLFWRKERIRRRKNRKGKKRADTFNLLAEIEPFFSIRSFLNQGCQFVKKIEKMTKKKLKRKGLDWNWN